MIEGSVSDDQLDPADALETGVVRHHRQLLPETVARMFEIPPASVDPATSSDIGLALGACLYMPALLPDLTARIGDLSARVGVTSTVICLEDSIRKDDLEAAEANLAHHVELLGLERLPVFVFVRPRSPDHLRTLSATLGSSATVLAGFALPKFNSRNGADWLAAVHAARERNPRLLAMPILEGSEVLDPQRRVAEIGLIGELLDEHADTVATIRIGATDLSGILGIRRGRSSTVYDVPPLANVMGDIITKWCHPASQHVLAGPVWEYYRQPSDSTPDLGLIREAERDIECGLVGKSVIHPSQVRVVNALLSVSWSDWIDACTIMSGPGGVSPSALRDRMNEAGPHSHWAIRTKRRAAVYGVLREGVEPVELIGAV